MHKRIQTCVCVHTSVQKICVLTELYCTYSFKVLQTAEGNTCDYLQCTCTACVDISTTLLLFSIFEIYNNN